MPPILNERLAIAKTPMPRTEPVVADAVVFRAMVDVIAEVGPAQLTLARIGAKAGLTAGALVLRFGSKKGLLDAFAAQSRQNVRQLFAAAASRHRHDPWAAAIDALVELSESVAEPRAFAHHLAWFALELADPELRPYATSHAQSVQAELTALVGDPALARHLRAVHQGAMLLWALDPGVPLAAAVRRELAAIRRP